MQTKSYRWLRYSYKPWSRSTNSALLSGPRLTRTASTRKHGMTRWITSDLQNQHPLLVAYDSLLHLSLYRSRQKGLGPCHWCQILITTFCHTNHFQGEDQRGWNQCRIFVQRMFGSVYLQSEKNKHLMRFLRQLLYNGTPVLSVWCRVHQLTSFKLNPCLLISSTLLILQPLQNSAVNTLFEKKRKQWQSFSQEHDGVHVCGAINNNILTLLVSSQKTLGTVTKLKCFSSSAHLSEFLASFSKSSSWANVPFKSYIKSKEILILTLSKLSCSVRHLPPLHTLTVC